MMSTRKILHTANIILAAGCLTLWILLALRWYCNRLELVKTIENEFYTVKQYIDWSKSKYCRKDKDPWVRGDDHHIVIKSNGNVLIRFREIDCYGETAPRRISYIHTMQKDTLILKRVHSIHSVGRHYVFIHIPLRKGQVTDIKKVEIKAYRNLRDYKYPFNPVPLDSLCYRMQLW